MGGGEGLKVGVGGITVNGREVGGAGNGIGVENIKLLKVGTIVNDVDLRRG
jgi:hypothetical protein